MRETDGRPQSVQSVLVLGVSTRSNAGLNPINLTISHLLPDTLYSLYCVGETTSGPTSFEDMINNRVSFTTHCCKQITLKLLSGSLIAGTSSSKIIQVKLDSPPTSDVVLQLSGRRSLPNSEFEEANLFLPNQITFSSSSWSVLQTVGLLPSPPGDYQIIVNLSTSSMDHLEIFFETSDHLMILKSSAELPSPELDKAQFSNDGTVIYLSFTEATDQGSGQFTRDFSCSLVFLFPGSDTSRCYFLDSKNVVISPRGVHRIQVNELITLLSQTLREECFGNVSSCKRQRYIVSSSTAVLSPVTPVIPVVIINAPQSIGSGSCDSPGLDISSSTGGAGREWFRIQVSVTSNSHSTEDLNLYFATKPLSEMNSLIRIPSHLLSPGVSYLFQVRLCNFLGTCGVASHRIERKPYPLPTLLTVGSDYFTQTAAEKVSIRVRGGGGGSQSLCNATASSSVSLDYEWSLLQNGVRTDEIQSISNSPSHFLLSPYTLQSGSLYQISVTVTAKEKATQSQYQSQAPSNSSSAAMATFFVNVIPSKLVLLMEGSTHRFLRKGSSILIDASRSYDPDSRFIESSYSFKWNCYQQSPTLSSQCGLVMDSISKGIVSVTVSQSSLESVAVGNVFVMTFTMFDHSRETTMDIFITIGESTDPTVLISPFTLHSGKWNPSKDLSISGVVMASQPLRAHWKSEDSLNLNGRNMTILSKLCVEGTNQMNFVLKGGSLLGSSTPYTFSLSVDGFASAASIEITMNTPPLPGSFDVSPSNGTMLVTKFSFSASMFIDEDLPITYQFAYLSDGRSMVLQSRSRFTSMESVLPQGSPSDESQLTCLVNVYDGLNSSTSVTSVVTVVGPKETSSVLLEEYIQTQTTAMKREDSDSLKQMISIGVSMLNQRDCFSSPNCAILHRLDCSSSTTDNTCGSCLDGFFGDMGDGNTTCVDVKQFGLTLTQMKSCHDDLDCVKSMEICSSGQCHRRNQSCLGDCNGHGICETRNIYTGQLLPFCAIGDPSCQSSCLCESNWKARDCSVSTEEFVIRENVRTQLLLRLTEVSEMDEPSDDQVSSWIDSLSAIAQKKDEISVEGANLINDLAASILHVTSSPSDLLNILDVLDLSLFVGTESSNSRRLGTQSTSEQLSLVEQYGAMLSKSLVPGQVGFEKVYSSFRFSSQVMTQSNDKEMNILLPQSPIERAIGAIQPHCQTFFRTTNELEETTTSNIVMSVISMNPTLSQTTDNNISSSLLSLQMDTPTPISSIVCTLPSHQNQVYLEEAHEYLNVTCEENDYTTHQKTCSQSLQTEAQEATAKTLTVTCHGVKEFISLHCPVMTRLPLCIISDLSLENSWNCIVISFNSSSVTCECKHLPHQMNETRSLSKTQTEPLTATAAATTTATTSAIASTGIQLYSISQEIITEFEVTIMSANSLDSSSVTHSLTILLMYGVMWGAGFLLISLSYLQKNQTKHLTQFHQNKIKAITKSRQANTSEEIQRMLTKYLDEIFPTVFQTQSYLTRMMEEIMKHHRYVILFSTRGQDLKMKRIVTCVHLLTIQSMLMCMLAVLYDLQVLPPSSSILSLSLSLSPPLSLLSFTHHAPHDSHSSFPLTMELATHSQQVPPVFMSQHLSTLPNLNALGNPSGRIPHQPQIMFASINNQRSHFRSHPLFLLTCLRLSPSCSPIA
jgi:hypothetical protein